MAQINETAGGLVDGINSTFTTSVPYRSASVMAAVNGAACIPAELGGVAFQLPNPPKAGDTVTARFQAVS
jgi:acyl dehydratase